MVRYFARRSIAAFERRWNYDASYLREMLEDGGVGTILPLRALGKVTRFRRGIPARPYYAAKVTAALAADCGPCAQLVVSMAESEGIGAEWLRAVVAGNREALSEDEQLAYDFARAALAREPADDIRRRIRQRWGANGLASLAYALVAAQAFPAFKYALGHGRSCVRLRAAGTELSRTDGVWV